MTVYTGADFYVDESGKIRLKAGRKKIDLSKLTDDDLRKLGIDPSLSKQEIARLLKVSHNQYIDPLFTRSLGVIMFL